MKSTELNPKDLIPLMIYYYEFTRLANATDICTYIFLYNGLNKYGSYRGLYYVDLKNDLMGTDIVFSMNRNHLSHFYLRESTLQEKDLFLKLVEEYECKT